MAIQNYTLSDFLTEVKTRLNEVSNDGLWSTANLTSKINTALLRVVMDTRIYRKDLTIPVTQNVSFYQMPTDCLIPLFLYTSALWGSLRLFPSFLLSLDKMYGGMFEWEKDSSNDPQVYVPFSYNWFFLWPAPSAVSTVSLHYVQQPSILVNNTDTTSLPLVAQKLIPIQAAYLAMLKLDMKKAMIFQKEYRQRLISAVELTRHELQTRPTVMAPGRSFDRSQANPSVRAYRNSRRYY